MVSPLGYITPYQKLDLSPLNDAVDNINDLRQKKQLMAQQQAQFDEEQKRLADQAALKSADAKETLAQEIGKEQLAGRKFDFEREKFEYEKDKDADAILKDFSSAAQEGNLAGIEAMNPRMGRMGMTLEPEMEAQEQAPVLPPLGDSLRLRPPPMQLGEPPAPVERPLLPGQILPPLRDPSQSFGQAPPPRQRLLPDDMQTFMRPPEAPEPLRPAPEQVPSGRVRVVRGGQPMGTIDLGEIQRQNTESAAESARAWATTPQNDAEIAAAQERVIDGLMRSGVGRKEAIAMANAQAQAEKNRRAAADRASMVQQGVAGRQAVTQEAKGSKDDYTAYRDEVRAIESTRNVKGLNEANALANEIIAAAESDNPVAQLRAKTNYFKSAMKGALSDRDMAMLLTAQSKLGQLTERMDAWLGNPQIDPKFLDDLKANAELVLDGLNERRTAVAQEAYNTIVQHPGISQASRELYANQAAGRILGMAPTEPAKKKPALQDVPKAMPDGSAIPSLGVTSGPGPKASQVDANSRALQLLE